jgi:hypothetical protein
MNQYCCSVDCRRHEVHLVQAKTRERDSAMAKEWCYVDIVGGETIDVK